VGIRAALAHGAACVLLLNTDAVVTAGALARLEAGIQIPDVGVAGPVITTTSPPMRIESAGIQYSMTTGRLHHIGDGQLGAPNAPNVFRVVDAVSGCAMLIRREVFDAIGLLDESYFFGFEDVDFCLRARRAGWTTVCAREAVVRHQGNATIGRRSPRRVYFATKYHLQLASTHGIGGPAVGVLRSAGVLGLNLVHALCTSDVPRVAGLRAWAHGARDYFAER
jgi:GT2 family glycosyltransferase